MLIDAEFVTNLIGQTPTSGNVLMAEAIIEDFVDIPFDNPSIFFASDLRRIKKAIAWQSLWLGGQTAVEERSHADSLSVDGMSMSVKSRSQVLLSPYAINLLNKLSWRTGSIRPRIGRPVPQVNTTFFTEDHVYDGWQTLPNYGN